MKIYKLSQPVEEKTLKWECPVTGNYILGHFWDDEAIEYGVYDKDGSFYDSFDNFFHASNWTRKHVNKKFKAPYDGIRIASLNKTAFLDGEWWIIDGTAHFADGEVGEFNHEAYVIRHAQELLMDGEEDWEIWKSRKAIEMYEEIKDNYSEDEVYEMRNEVQNDTENFIVNHMDEVGLDNDMFFIANGNSSKDPREWSMKNFGWKRMAGNNITTWTLTSSDLESIKRGIWDAFEPGQLEWEKFNIEVMSNKKMFWNVPLDVIESGNIRSLMEYITSYAKWSSVINTNQLKIYRKSSKTIKVYHGSSNTFNRFNSKYSAQGVFWFTEDINKIKEGTSGATSSKYIAEVELTVYKTAGWEEYEKLCLFQIENDGFDSIKLDDDWIIFDNNRIKILRWVKNE